MVVLVQKTQILSLYVFVRVVVRFYPDNEINPHLPVTHGPPSTSTARTPSEAPDNYFTVTNRKINGVSGQTAPSVLLLCVVIMHTIISTV